MTIEIQTTPPPLHILSGGRAREPGIDIVRVQDVGLSRAPDPVLLE